MKQLVLLLLLCGPVLAANDFASDADCVALWKMDDGALTTDTLGGNTLTNLGAKFSADTDEADHKEGDASAYANSGSNQGLYITDDNLDADFPWEKNIADATYSIAFWVKFNTLQTSYIISKYYWSNGERSAIIAFGTNAGDSDRFQLIVYHSVDSGNSVTPIYHTADTWDGATATWYHVGVTYNDTTNEVNTYIYTDGGSTSSDSGDFGADLYVGSSEEVYIGSGVNGTSGKIDGWIDEVVVWKRVLTESEMVDVREGDFAVGGAASAAQIF